MARGFNFSRETMLLLSSLIQTISYLVILWIYILCREPNYLSYDIVSKRLVQGVKPWE